MKHLVVLLALVFLPSLSFSETLSCASGEHPEFADVVKGKSKNKGDVINTTYQTTQTEAIDEAFQELVSVNQDCVDNEGGTLVRDAAWRRTPQGPANACYQLGNGQYLCRVLATRHVLCCVPN